ncbi:acyl-CoA dehydrogenase family protein [Streptomyces spectabilis]|uniref:acyl-CoA dehydrogenase family protein n=1 Tax=Streptomyces spectabilis TaxID=68270 RepID=UPI0033F2031D
MTSAQTQLRQLVADFTTAEVDPRVRRMEAHPDRVERDLAVLMGAQGWFGVTIPTELGGMGAGHLAKTLMLHQVAQSSAATAALLQASQLPVSMIMHFGSERQKRQLLPPVAAGEQLLSIAVTEKDSGGHVLGMQTTARRDGRDWIIEGSKRYIGNSHLAHLHCVIARTAPADQAGSRALSAFLIEHDRPGLTVKRHRPALGLHGFSFGRLTFNNVRVPARNMIGEEGDGKDIAYSSSILYGRPNLAAVSLGVHQAIVHLTAAYLRSTPRYGATLADLDVLHDRLGRMRGRLTAARDLAYEAVHRLDHGLACDERLINSKYLSHQWAVQSGQDAMDMHGARALEMSYPLQRYWRDVQCTYAPAGTGEVQRKRLAAYALGKRTTEWSRKLAPKTSLFRAPRTP